MKHKGKKVGILFSGGPAPSANTVISSTALNFLDSHIPVIGIFKGYEYIQDFNINSPDLQLREDLHYTEITYSISQVRNERGIFLKTSRANPGKKIKVLEDLSDKEKNKRLQNILEAFDYLRIGALISIGGDDTLKTANFLCNMGFPVIHIPKTIDNDYYGIPWTFGYWTAVDTAQKIILDLKADAQATALGQALARRVIEHRSREVAQDERIACARRQEHAVGNALGSGDGAFPQPPSEHPRRLDNAPESPASLDLRDDSFLYMID